MTLMADAHAEKTMSKIQTKKNLRSLTMTNRLYDRRKELIDVLNKIRSELNISHEELKKHKISTSRRELTLNTFFLISLSFGCEIKIGEIKIEGVGETLDLLKSISLKRYKSLIEMSESMGKDKTYAWAALRRNGRNLVCINPIVLVLRNLGLKIDLYFNGEIRFSM